MMEQAGINFPAFLQCNKLSEGDNMQKADFIYAVALEKYQYDKSKGRTRDVATLKKATEWVEVMLDVLEQAFIDGEKVRIVNFGTFEVRDHKAHYGPHPQTGEIIEMKPSKTIKFTPCTALKKKIQGLLDEDNEDEEQDNNEDADSELDEDEFNGMFDFSDDDDDDDFY